MGSILKILATIIPFILNWFSSKNTPSAKQLKKKEEIDEALAKGDANKINVLVDDSIRLSRAKNTSGDSK